MKRIAENRGGFYPYNCSEIEQMISLFNERLRESSVERSILSLAPQAVISPHAGYIYSGYTANIAHRLIGNRNPKRVVVIGPSHHVYFEGISGSDMDSYETPCGDLSIDRDYLQELTEKHEIIFVPDAHAVEHSTETQMPFIRHYSPDTQVIELIYGGRYDHHLLAMIIEKILSDHDSAVVISSDLSHFYTLEEAERIDRICLSGVAQLDVGILDSGCEACGIIGIKALVEAARRQDRNIDLLDYTTSASAGGDTRRVVGYMSAAML